MVSFLKGLNGYNMMILTKVVNMMKYGMSITIAIGFTNTIVMLMFTIIIQYQDLNIMQNTNYGWVHGTTTV